MADAGSDTGSGTGSGTVRNASVGRRLGLALVVLLALLVLAEVGARVAGWGPPDDGLVYLGDDALVFVLAPGQSVVAGRHADTGERPHVVTVDDEGHRSTGARPARGDARRIVLLGDSLTFGPGVDDDRTYAARLERALSESSAGGGGGARGVEVVNAAVNGYSTFHYARWAEHRLAEVDPDLLVVALYVGNDNELDLQARVQVPVPGERLLWRTALGYAFRDAWRERGWLARRADRGPMDPDLPADLVPLAGRRQHELDLKQQRKLWQHAMGHLATVRDRAAAAGAELVVLLLPVHWELKIEHESDAHVFLRDRLAALDVPVLTVLDELREVQDTCWLPYDTGHLSAEGHAVVGETLAAKLRDGGFLDDD